jgi:Ca-activated chloride channel family protein
VAMVALALLSALRFPVSGFAAEDTSVYAAPLSKLVERLAAQPVLTAQDYASLAQETVTWGHRLQESQQPVLPGPVHDALAGVAAGEALSSTAADWTRIRSNLEELLKEPPKPPPQPKPKQQQQQQQKEQPQRDQQKQDQQPSPDQQQQQQSQHPESKTQNGQPPPSKPPEQANTGENQKIGGQPQTPDDRANPSLALPIQKLDQLRNQDSPAELFQLLDSREHRPPPKPGRDW